METSKKKVVVHDCTRPQAIKDFAAPARRPLVDVDG
jgi:hypothetical protein